MPREELQDRMGTTNMGRDRSLSDLYVPEDEVGGASGATDLGQLLLEQGVVRNEQLVNARTIVGKSPGMSLAAALQQSGVDEEVIQRAAAHLAGLPFQRVDPDAIDDRAFHRLGVEFCKAHCIVPLHTAGSRLVLGVVAPDNLLIIDEVRMKLGVAIKPVVITHSDVERVIEAFTEDEQPETEVIVDDIIAGIEEDDVEVVQKKEEEVDLEKMAGESPVIRFVNFLIFDAVKQGASDIHVEPQEKRLQVRYRIDGLLFEVMSPPHTMHAAIVSRLKIMANLDISERRLPQDGRIRAMIHGRKLDLRLSTLPTAQGEKAVMRLLDTKSIQVSLDDLGMGEDLLVMWKRQIDNPHGILLVTGPTGSGKTTTLYSSLGQMDRARLNISTVEDPVEYHLSGINQTQTHEKIGMTFAAALRALLRQDPDVVMLGEIRDIETATIAIQASLTGHLVLSTLHTNDAPSAVTRLINIGVESFLIGAAVNGVLAQRLVRRICSACKIEVEPSEQVAHHLMIQGMPSNVVWAGQGCEKCRGTGYAGRVGLYELLVLDDMLRDKVAQSPNVTEFRRICVERGMVTLRHDGFQKVLAGQTTVDEVLRVTEANI